MLRLGRLMMLAAVLAPVGCSTMSNTEKGVGIGAALGTGAGLAVGAATGNPKTGAVVGGLLGAGTGGLIGNAADEKEKEAAAVQQAEATAAAQQQAAQAGRIGITDVVSMTQQGIGDDVIIGYIRNSHTRFTLAPSDISYLHSNRVSDRVITEMMNTGNQPTAVVTQQPRTVVVQQPPPVVVYERPYWGRPYYAPPPPPIGFGVVIRR